MTNPGLRHLGVLLSLILILAILFFYGRSLDAIDEQLIAPTLRNVSADDARVNEYVALLHTGLHNNYDHLNELLQAIDADIHRVETQLSTMSFRQDEKLQSDLRSLRKQFEVKEQYIEHFKSRNAVLRNSMMFISLASSQISEQFGRDRDVAMLVGRLSILLMKFYRSADPATILTLRDQLASQSRQASSPELRQSVRQLLLHVNLTINYVPEINRIMTAIATSSLRDGGEVLMQDYLRLFAEQKARARFFRWITYALSVVLLGYLAYILWRLQSSRAALVRANRELAGEKDRATATLHSIGDGVMTLSHLGIVEFLNPVAERLTGWPLAEAQGLHVSEVLNVHAADSDQPLTPPAFEALIRDSGSAMRNDMLLHGRDGENHNIQVTASPISSEGSVQQGVVLVIRDITVTRHLIERISHQAQHDALTGLTNRREFERRLKRVLEDQSGARRAHALCYVDLDQFKVINDTCGHMAGDELLRQLSRALAARVRSADTLARLGGDEFGVLLEDCPLSRAMDIADQLRLAVYEHVFVWEGNRFSVGASIGVVPLGPGDGDTQQAMTRADLACYAAKDLGRNRIHVYTTDDASLARRQREMVWAGNIRHALSEQRMRLYAQPIVPTNTSSDGQLPDHYEVLVRLLDTTGQEIMPEEFIPAAERFGVMPDVDRWVIAQAFAWLAQRASTSKRINLCINLSGTSLGDAGLPGFIEERRHYHDLDARQICFEITETAAVTNLHEAVSLMERLRRQGMRFSLDDFGSGLSSFNYLKTLPVDYLKIDGSIVRNVVNDPIHRAMVEAINHLGHVMGKQTIAEFVENDSIHQELAKLGVDLVQGYAIGKPALLTSLS